jgi:hypothetical protein
MTILNPLREHHTQTLELALGLCDRDVRTWLLTHGYYPEAYVLPPCFSVESHPDNGTPFFDIKSDGRFKPERTECVTVHFPKSRLTDRTFGIIDPRIHHDIVLALTSPWSQVVRAMFPESSEVACFSFPIPVDSRQPGRIGHLRSGRSIYEFLRMAEDEIVAVAHEHSHIVRSDIKNFYRSIYTHSIAWAIHGKSFIREKKNLHDYNLLGNRLDSLFQNASDGCTNGIPIGPVVSDIIAEIVVGAVDARFTKAFKAKGIKCQAVRFKDDYRILVDSEADGIEAVKCLQVALKEFNLELAEEKTEILALPDGLFRPWVSLYHAALPRKRRSYSWREFRELYLSVLRIDRQCPGTGVIDRFLADIVARDGYLRVRETAAQLPNILSMLFMLARLRVKAFPKILAIVECILATPMGQQHRSDIVAHLEEHLIRLAEDEERNKYLISWISYFLASNDLLGYLQRRPLLKDPITRMPFENRNALFLNRPEFVLFRDCLSARRQMTLLKYLDVFDPPKEDGLFTAAGAVQQGVAAGGAAPRS